MNIALFPLARVHDFQATYIDDEWIKHGPDFDVSPSVRMIATPGHTPQDITTLVSTPAGLIALTHLWWSATGPVDQRSINTVHRSRDWSHRRGPGRSSIPLRALLQVLSEGPYTMTARGASGTRL